MDTGASSAAFSIIPSCCGRRLRRRSGQCRNGRKANVTTAIVPTASTSTTEWCARGLGEFRQRLSAHTCPRTTETPQEYTIATRGSDAGRRTDFDKNKRGPTGNLYLATCGLVTGGEESEERRWTKVVSQPLAGLIACHHHGGAQITTLPSLAPP
eukprot:gene17538-biopygen12886